MTRWIREGRGHAFARRVAVLTVVLLLIAGTGAAHVFNHEDRHEVCDLTADAVHHALADGHSHWHHNTAAPAHMHGETLHPDGHTHADVMHDPCNQIGAKRVAFPDAAPFTVDDPVAAVLAPPVDEVVSIVFDPGDALPLPRLEVFALQVPALTEQHNMVISGDRGLALFGFPGSGTPEDPYVISGYHIKDRLIIKDTSRCVVVRDNVIAGPVFETPRVDFDLLVDLEELVAELTLLSQAAHERLDLAAAERARTKAEYETQRDVLREWQSDRADVRAQRTALVTDYTDARDARNAAYEAWRTVVTDTETAVVNADDLVAARADADDTRPTPPTALTFKVNPASDWHRQRYAAYLADVAAYVADVAALFPGDVADELTNAVAAIEADVAARETDIKAKQAATTQAWAAYAAFLPEYRAFESAYRTYLKADYYPARDAYRAAARAYTNAYYEARDIDRDLTSAKRRAAVNPFEYAGEGFATLEAIATALLEAARGEIDEVTAARLVLDWNGPCIHAYHNVVQDLRVNQNNHRTGVATGGVIEDNRLMTVGQIRHYDGDFRENEVGDRGHAFAVTGEDGARATSDRAVNVDGFNQGKFRKNVIYGALDLDFHGHHHGAGFLAPESHYHGDADNIAYMQNPDGSCMAEGHHHGDEGLGLPPPPPRLDPVTRRVLPAHKDNCLPHHDHSKRWTSVTFEDNVVIDPWGYGVRYEDRNHDGDDRYANSEALTELNLPHMHRSHVALANNAIIGSLWVDVFNADGVEIWADDGERVAKDRVDRVQQLLTHLGSEIVNSHHSRNDGWLDVTENAVFLFDGADGMRIGVRVNDAKEADRLEIAANRVFLAPSTNGAAGDVDALVTFLRDARTDDADAVAAALAEWGTPRTDAGATTAVRFDRVRDADVTVCANVARGIDRGLVAVAGIAFDVALTTCPDNDWGRADPAVNVHFSERRADDPLTNVARELTAGTAAGPAADFAGDEADGVLRHV